MRDATIPPTLEEHWRASLRDADQRNAADRERNARLVAALVAAEKYLIGYQVDRYLAMLY